ncbi:hypothetical protein IC582_005210 [Cucumis melo]
MHSKILNFHAKQKNSSLWHFRLGHLAPKILILILSRIGLSMSSSLSTCNCTSCLKAKMKNLPFPMSLSTSLTPLALVHSDVWGPSPIISSHGSQFYVSFIDNFSKFTWLFPIAYKSDVPSIVQEFVPFIENQLSQKMKVFRFDGGGEFCNNSLQSFFEIKGISHQKSCPYTPKQNDIAEHKHRPIVETTMSLIFHSSSPLEFWPYAFSTVVFLINRMPSLSLHVLSPFEKFFLVILLICII